MLLLPVLALLFALRATALGVWLHQPLNTALGVAAAVPHLLAILLLSRSASLSLPPRFELKLTAQLALLLVAGLAWAMGQGLGALAHGAGKRGELELPVVFLAAGHVVLGAWLAGIVKDNAFGQPRFVMITKRVLAILVGVGCGAVAFACRQ
ncbi:hypothetical protein WME79_15070 [Sorangium sp. So ce726]|uniref:hypothetical protein n=1 Tax=Sorangium sp. So ce726 TaxID=3133319 RepID=UPI003F611960